MTDLLNLPLELHIEIWSYLVEPGHLARTCKALLQVSRNKHVRLANFLAQGSRGAIFAAMKRPKIFDKDVFQSLIKAGAILPRNLVQELQIRFGLANSDRAVAVSIGSWAINIEPDAVLAVLSEGYRQYGSYDLSKTDNRLYCDWLANESSSSAATDSVKALIRDKGFAFLPFGRCQTHHYYDHRVYEGDLSLTKVKAVKINTSLAHPLYFSGQDLTPEEKAGVVSDFFLRAGKLGADGLMKALKPLFEHEQLQYQLPQELAKGVVLSLKHVGSVSALQDSHYVTFDVAAESAWKALKALDDSGLLRIDLPHLIKDVARKVASEPTTAEWRALQKRLCEDCPYVRPQFAKGRWMQEFIDHQKAIHALSGTDARTRWKRLLANVKTIVAARRALCGQTVTPVDIIHLLMRSEMMNDTLPLTFAANYVDIPDWTVFARRLIRKLLCQIYKGSMLRALSVWFTSAVNIDFPSLLTEEVRRVSTCLEKMPTRRWRLRRKAYTNEWAILPTYEEGKGSIFGVVPRWSFERLLEQLLAYPEQIPDDADPETIFDNIEPHKGDVGRSEMTSFLEKAFRGYSYMNRSSLLADKEKSPRDSLHNAQAIVEVCGSQSTAAQIVAKRAVLHAAKLNDYSGACDLILALYEIGCEVTVWHILAFQQQGSALPDKFLAAIKFKGPRDPENIWPVIASHAKHSRLNKGDVARITTLPRLDLADGESAFLRVELVPGQGLVPKVELARKNEATTHTEATSDEDFEDYRGEESSVEKTTAGISEPRQDVQKDQLIPGPSCKPVAGEPAGDSLRVHPVRTSMRIAAACNMREPDAVADEEILVVSDWLPERIRRSEAQRRIHHLERWIEILEALLAVEKMRRKVQVRSFKQVTTGNSHTNSAGPSTEFEKKTPTQINELKHRLDLLQKCLRSNGGPNDPSQSLLQESLDMQRLLQEDDEATYRAMQAEMAADFEAEHSGSIRRRRSQMPKRKSYRKALAQLPAEFGHGAVTPGELSEDDGDFAPDPLETDEEVTEDDGSDFEKEPAPKRKRRSHGN